MDTALQDFELAPYAHTQQSVVPNSCKRSNRAQADRGRSAAARKAIKSATITIMRNDVMTIKPMAILSERLIPSGKLLKPIPTKLPRDANGHRLRMGETDVRSDMLRAWPDGQEATTLVSSSLSLSTLSF